MATTSKPEVKRPRGRPRKKVETRGGLREGSGRKPSGNALVRLQLYVSQQTKDLCPAIKERGINYSEEFEKLIRRYAGVFGLLDETKHE